MPNWCYTDIEIYSKSKANINDLACKVSWALSTETLSPDAWDGDSSWLGNILLHYGYDYAKVANGDFGRCRGCIFWNEEPDELDEKTISGEKYYGFKFCTETAWCPMLKMWDSIIKAAYPNDESMKIAYIAEEEGMEIFEYDDEHHWLHHTEDNFYFFDAEISSNSLSAELEDYYHERIEEHTAVWILNKVFQHYDKGEIIVDDIRSNQDLQSTIQLTKHFIRSDNEDDFFHLYRYEYCPVEDIIQCD